MATFSGSPFPTVASGKEATVAIKSDGSVESWGAGELVPAPALSSVVSVAANDDGCVALHSDGTITFFGRSPGTVGLDNPPALSNFVQVDIGKYAAIATHADGTVTGWGHDYQGVLSIPAGLSDVRMVAVGDGFAVALKNDGSLVQWGSAPASLPSISNVAYISCYRDSTLALLDDGTVSEWGGETTVPLGLSGVVGVAASAGTSVAVKDDGTYEIWGFAHNAPSGVTTAYACSGGFEARGILHADGSLTMWSFGMGGDTAVPAGLNVMLPGESQSQDYIDSAVPISASIGGKTLPNGSASGVVSVLPEIVGMVGPIGSIHGGVSIQPSMTGYQDWVSKLPEIELQEVYRLVITGAADGLPDLYIGKMSSWQATSQSGTRASYLQAVLPAASELLPSIADRQNGNLVIQKGYRFQDGSTRYEEVVRARFDGLRPDRGRRALTVTVSGYLSGMQSANGFRALSGVRSVSTQNGKRRVRCSIDFFLKPGMLVGFDGDSFEASYINYYVNQNDKFCEVGER